MAPLQFLSCWRLILTAAGKDSVRCGIRESCSLQHQNMRASRESKRRILSLGGRKYKRSIGYQEPCSKNKNRQAWAAGSWLGLSQRECSLPLQGGELIIVHVTVIGSSDMIEDQCIFITCDFIGCADSQAYAGPAESKMMKMVPSTLQLNRSSSEPNA